ncbi:MAG: DUF2231 domain-containing protein [Isosphaeraceae bacterium]
MAASTGGTLMTDRSEKGRGTGGTINANLTASEQQEGTMPNYILAASVYETLHQFVSAYKVHPILVNFTAALVPISVGSDILGWVFGKQTLRDTGWWTLCFAAVITPFTAIAGWLFWMEGDVGVPGMTIHKWLGTSLAVLLVGLVLWRWWFFKSNRRPSVFYLLVALAVIGAVVYQGHLGGDQSFGSM